MTYLIFGSGGQLGSEFVQQLQTRGENVVGADMPDGDITSLYSVRDLCEGVNPTVVINAAAFTNVDAAESQPAVCRRVNALGPQNLAQVCAERDIPLVHFSTDYVFCGTSQRTPLTESDLPVPAGVYAQTKFDGEQNIQRTHVRHVILRTCGLYGTPGPNTLGNFVETMRKLGASRRNLRVVNDQHCTPTWIPDLVRAAIFLQESESWGLFHVTNTGATTWFDFASNIFQLCDLRVEMSPITTAEWGAPAPRPLYSVLDTGKYHALPGAPAMQTWQSALEEYLISTRNS